MKVEKRTDPETEDPFDERPAEDMTNDSLGTVDPADSSGLDSDQPQGGKKPRGEQSDSQDKK